MVAGHRARGHRHDDQRRLGSWDEPCGLLSRRRIAGGFPSYPSPASSSMNIDRRARIQSQRVLSMGAGLLRVAHLAEQPGGDLWLMTLSHSAGLAGGRTSSDQFAGPGRRVGCRCGGRNDADQPIQTIGRRLGFSEGRSRTRFAQFWFVRRTPMDVSNTNWELRAAQEFPDFWRRASTHPCPACVSRTARSNFSPGATGRARLFLGQRCARDHAPLARLKERMPRQFVGCRPRPAKLQLGELRLLLVEMQGVVMRRLWSSSTGKLSHCPALLSAHNLPPINSATAG